MENPITGAVHAQQLRTPDKPRRLLSAAVITCGEQITHCGHKPLVLGKKQRTAHPRDVLFGAIIA